MSTAEKYDPRIKRFSVEFPYRGPQSRHSSHPLEPGKTYYGRIKISVTEPVPVTQLLVKFEGWEQIDLGSQTDSNSSSKSGVTRKELFKTAEDVLQAGGSAIDTLANTTEFWFACTMPGINFPAAMQSAICKVAYSLQVLLAGFVRQRPASAVSANNQARLATSLIAIQVAPRVMPSGVGWIKPLVLRDGVVITPGAGSSSNNNNNSSSSKNKRGMRRRWRKRAVEETAMNICVNVRNHCCTLGEAIGIDLDTAMLQRDRVLTFVRAAIVEQVSLKPDATSDNSIPSVGAGVILAERTLNRKVTEIDPSARGNDVHDWHCESPPSSPFRSSSRESPELSTAADGGLSGVKNLHIRVPRHDVCTAEGFSLSFSHVLRLTFGLTSRPSSGRFDTQYASKDVPLRLVTSKFGDMGRQSQAEIDKRLSALTVDGDNSAAAEAYGYLLGENNRADRPDSLAHYSPAGNLPPAPIIVALADPDAPLYSPRLSTLGAHSMSGVSNSEVLDTPSPVPIKHMPFQYGPLPPVPTDNSVSSHSLSRDDKCLEPIESATTSSISNDSKEYISASTSSIKTPESNSRSFVSSAQSQSTTSSSPAHLMLTPTQALHKQRQPATSSTSPNDKRESSRSEGEKTVVCSSPHFDDCYLYDEKKTNAFRPVSPSTRSSTPEPPKIGLSISTPCTGAKAPELPSLPPLLPLDNSMDTTVDDNDGSFLPLTSPMVSFSSYWANHNF